MGYNIKQITKSNNTTYLQSITSMLSTSTHSIQNPIKQNENFQDYVVKLNPSQNGGQAVKNYFSTEQSYYIRGKILRIPADFYSKWNENNYENYTLDNADSLNISVYLSNSEHVGQKSEQQYPFQKIGDFTVPAFNSQSQSENDKYTPFSFVFTPLNTNFDEILFRVNRTTYDWIESSKTPNTGDSFKTFPGYRDWLTNTSTSDSHIIKVDNDTTTTVTTTGDRMIFLGSNQTQQYDIGSLYNLVSTTQRWRKFGFQGRPGTQLVVNGQSIRVGRSGIYEINNGTDIKKLSIASPGGNVDAFLLDYAYQD